MIIYPQETDDNLAEIISASTSISYASILEPCDIEQNHQLKTKSLASVDDSDLYYVQSILVSSSWNKNDDIFDKSEVWAARKTPEDKPTNLEHDENLIIGHITSNWPIDDNGNTIDETVDPSSLPDKFHILTGSVIYRAFSNPDLKERAEKLIAEIEDGSKYVSMECYFKGFDYGLINKSTGEYKILERNDATAYLTKYLRAYGGSGEHEEYKLGRVLRSITFSGKGFVDKPANPDSIIFTKQKIDEIFAKKNDDLSNSGVILNKSTSNDAENITMSEILEKEIAELSTKIDTITAGCAETVKEAHSLADELKESNRTLETSLTEANATVADLQSQLEVLKTEHEAVLSSLKSEAEEAAAAAVAAAAEAKSAADEQLAQARTEIEALTETLAGYKNKEEEMLKKEKMMNRKASLLEAGLEDEAASAAVEKFESLDDTSFDDMVAILAAMKPSEDMKMKKKEEEEAMMPKKKMASEDEAVSALEEVEAEETVELSVGSDETESQADSIRAELVEFVSARLNKNS